MVSKITRSNGDIKKVLNIKGEVIQTSCGPVEYASNGEGPVLLVVHGTPGGYDQGLLIGEIFRPYGFRVLSVSRPGYLGTPLKTGYTIEEQSKAIYELLNTLNIEKVGLVHISGGGPVGYTFAGMYPEKVWGQIAIDSVSARYDVSASSADQYEYINKFGLWYMDFVMGFFPKTTIDQILRTDRPVNYTQIEKRISEIVKDKWMVEWMKALMQTMGLSRFRERKSGLVNDLSFFSKIDKLPLGNITCPTLIVHGDRDSDVLPTHADYAKQCIKGSKLYWINNGSHISFVMSENAAQVQEYMVNFLSGCVTAAV